MYAFTVMLYAIPLSILGIAWRDVLVSGKNQAHMDWRSYCLRLALIGATIATFTAMGLQKVVVANGIRLYPAFNASGAVVAIPRLEESVRAELIRMQEQTGLTLASEVTGLEIVLFEKRSLIRGARLLSFVSWGVVSRDGSEVAAQYRTRDNMTLRLGIVRSDGSNLREYQDVRPQDICWSYDKSKLAMTVYKIPPDTELEVMDLRTKVVTGEINPRAKLTSQCWSPDDKRIVYQANHSVCVYEVGQDKSSVRVLGNGEHPTWSPDGSWIAFLDHDTYYAIRPNGQDRKKLFHRGDVYTGLWWSPDSRIVAYVALARLALDDVYQLRVRRLEDNSEDWVAEGQIAGDNFQWVVNKQLLERVKSEGKSK